jgi:hypothetical protein
MSKSKRIVIALGIAVIVAGTYLWFFGVQTFFIFESRKIGREIPIVKSVPVELNDLSVSSAKGEKLSFMGIEFEVPWDDVDEKKSRTVGTWALIYFRSGNSIILCVDKPKGFMSNMFRNKIASPELFTRLYGPDVLNSDYALKKAIFRTTPSDISLLTSSSRAAGLGSVLVIKAIMPPTTDWAIFNIQSNVLKGFQLRDPKRRPKKMSLELATDDSEIEVNFEQLESKSTPAITQSEMNRIIQSARRIVDARPILTVSPG